MHKTIRIATSERNDPKGPGVPEIQKWVDSLLHRYSLHTNSFTSPIEPSVLAELQNATILYRYGSRGWIASIMPMGDGFVININKSLPVSTKRIAICHEIAHTFFFDTESKPPGRLNKPRADAKEERLCFWAAIEMLVPSQLFRNELDKLGYKHYSPLKSILKLAEAFVVSPDVITCKLTNNLSYLRTDGLR